MRGSEATIALMNTMPASSSSMKRALSAGEEARPRRHTLLYLLVETGQDIFGRQRSEAGCLIHRIADLECFHPPNEATLELIRDRFDHDEPLGGDARLAVVDGPRLN